MSEAESSAAFPWRAQTATDSDFRKRKLANEAVCIEPFIFLITGASSFGVAWLKIVRLYLSHFCICWQGVINITTVHHQLGYYWSNVIYLFVYMQWFTHHWHIYLFLHLYIAPMFTLSTISAPAFSAGLWQAMYSITYSNTQIYLPLTSEDSSVSGVSGRPLSTLLTSVRSKIRVVWQIFLSSHRINTFLTWLTYCLLQKFPHRN